jgi:uncharacterized membrane protein YesL
MRGIRIVGRGLHDTLEHLLAFAVLSMSWWAGVFLIITAPPATLALFWQADPRIGTERDRPSARETISFMRAHFSQSWGLALITMPLIGVLIVNIVLIRPDENKLGVLAPVWLFLLIVASFITAGAFTHVALLDFRVVPALKQSALMTAAHFPRIIIIAILLWIIIVLSVVLVIPMILFLPATFAATIERFVLDALKIPVIDPLSPTDERMIEEQKRRNSKVGP